MGDGMGNIRAERAQIWVDIRMGFLTNWTDWFGCGLYSLL